MDSAVIYLFVYVCIVQKKLKNKEVDDDTVNTKPGWLTYANTWKDAAYKDYFRKFTDNTK